MGAANLSVPDIDLKIESIEIKQTTRKLKARWDPTLPQDLGAYHPSLDGISWKREFIIHQMELPLGKSN